MKLLVAVRLPFIACVLLAAHTCPAQQQAAHPNAAAQTALAHEPLLLGAAWYPEQWPESRWEADLALMEQAHMHVVRVGEFAWSSMEPAEGRFDFTWLDHAIALAARHGIRTVLGTPTAAPPAWLTQRYPETLRVDENGNRAEHGNRQHFSFTSPTYRKFAVRIAGQMAKRYGQNPNVMGWQIDNELAAPSFDESARSQFHAWLKARYGTIADLNRRWATAYWSQTYDSFDQVPVHSRNQNPALLLDWKRFGTDAWISYMNAQVDVIRANAQPKQWITTNTMHWFQGFDHYKLHESLDIAAWDDYFPNGKLDPLLNAELHDLVRGYKHENFWVMETQPAFVNWGPVNAALPPGVTREMAWQAIAHGADAVLYWQWRSAPNGQEEYHGTLVGADGLPVPVYAEVQQFGADLERVNAALKQFGTTLSSYTTHSRVALLQSYDSHWAIDFQKHSNKFDYEAAFTSVYRAASSQAQNVDIISPDAPLAAYPIVFAPALNVLPDATAKHLLDYVRDGGRLVLTARSGMKDLDNGLQPARQPGPLAAALGARVEQFYALDAPVKVSGEAGSGSASVWAEDLHPTAADTRTLLTYGENDGWLTGHPAAISHAFGKGTITYLGADLDDALMSKFITSLLQGAGIHAIFAGLPAVVEFTERTSQNGGRVWLLINHNSEPQHIDVTAEGTDLLTGEHHLPQQLGPHEIAVWAVARKQ